MNLQAASADWRLCGALLLVAFVSATATAADKPKSKPSSKNESPVLATVDGQPIHADEVDRAVLASLATKKPAEKPNDVLRKQALELAIDQRLIERVLKRDKLLPTDKQLDAAMDQLRKDALASYPSWEDYLKERGQGEESLRWLTAWRWGWNAYLKEHLTDKAREEYFEAHQAEFDGTELRVSHILLKVPQSNSADAAAKTLEQASSLRRKIVEDNLEFAEAARQNSAGPSAKDGGDLGFIPRRGAMAEEFSQAAFALKGGEISEPVVSPFGVHLIRVTDVRPGDKTWQEVRGELDPHVIRKFFSDLAEAERGKAKVVYNK